MGSRVVLLFLLFLGLSASATARAATSAEALARLAVSENQAQAVAAIRDLRAMGPQGLQVLFEVYKDEIRRNGLDSQSAASPEWKRISAALDQVAQQRDAYSAGLYWYTDIEQAMTASKESGKPILSLRLLGNLSDEFSCANSRFFRAALYSNPAIARFLRENFILHWKSVRPVPRVTVDYGDGRKLERTITGNSIHYILDSEGRIVDALPGLYGPAAFLRELQQSAAVARQLLGQSPEKRAAILTSYHNARLDAASRAWAADVEKVGGKITEKIEARNADPNNPPSARAASRMAMTKAVTENGIVNAITSDTRTLARITDEETWNKIAALYGADAKLDPASIELIRRQNPYTGEQAGAQMSAQSAPDRFARVIQNFERAIALDTVRNEYLLRSTLRAWFISGNRYVPTGRNAVNETEAFNNRVYAQLFLTPSTDPWLGLVQPNTYTGLENDGVIK